MASCQQSARISDYRTEGKKWKVIKTIKSGKKVTFVDKKVKKNKVYRYKVRAYGTVKGKKVYGNFGYACKASLKKPTVKGPTKRAVFMARHLITIS